MSPVSAVLARGRGGALGNLGPCGLPPGNGDCPGFGRGFGNGDCPGFGRGLIRAETISCEDFVKFGGEAGAGEAGRMRPKGKDHVVQDGDVMPFRFNV